MAWQTFLPSKTQCRKPTMKTLVPAVLVAGALSVAAPALAADPLALENEIPLGDVAGPLDQLTLDLARERLFVAEPGASSVAVVDLLAAKVERQLTGVRAPRGIAYLRSSDTLYVTSGADGTLHRFSGKKLEPGTPIKLGGNADAVRADNQNDLVLVSYGRGELASVANDEVTDRTKIDLGAHTEGFELDQSGSKIFVNLPAESSVAVIDRLTGNVETRWPLKGLHANYPMALDTENHRMFIATRQPSGFVVLQTGVGDVLQGEKPYGAIIYAGRTCADADDLFFDARRNRVYVICGEGFIDTFQSDTNGYIRVAHQRTVPGARTGLFSPGRQRLYLAVSAAPGVPAAVWVYRPE
jgi:DNA-binding beta-propeller fold protein YncE